MNEDVPLCNDWTPHPFETVWGDGTAVAGESEVKGRFGIGRPAAGESYPTFLFLFHLPTGIALNGMSSAMSSRDDLKELAGRLEDVVPEEADAEAEEDIYRIEKRWATERGLWA